MAFRLLHTADWQIGMKAAQAGAAAEQVRAARLEAARRVVALADAHAVDALLLAGDTFEDSTVPPRLVQEVVLLLRNSRAPVFVLPANHDPLLPGGLFDHPAWRDAAPHVTVLRELGPVAIGPADLFACPLRERHSVDDPLARLPDAPPAPRTHLRLAVAHGSVRGGPVPDGELADDFPIDLAHAERAGLDWLALGHWHAPSSYVVAGAVRAAYCGAHEPTKFGERNAQGASGQCLLVTLTEPGAPPQVEALPTAQLEWRREKVELRDGADLAALRARLDGEPASARERVLLDLEVAGVVGSDVAVAVEALRDLLAQRFLHARLGTRGLLLRPDDAGWIATLPPGAPRSAAQSLLAAAGAVGGDPQAARVAQRALELLYRFHLETGGTASSAAGSGAEARR